MALQKKETDFHKEQTNVRVPHFTLKQSRTIAKKMNIRISDYINLALILANEKYGEKSKRA